MFHREGPLSVSNQHQWTHLRDSLVVVIKCELWTVVIDVIYFQVASVLDLQKPLKRKKERKKC